MPSYIRTKKGRSVSLLYRRGEQTIRVSLIGYSTLVREVTVNAGETTALSLRITPTVLKLDEVVVTGTSVEEFAIDLPYAVTAVDRAALAEQGAPQLVELFKNLSVSHGVIGERQSWYNSAGPPASVQESVSQRKSPWPGALPYAGAVQRAPAGIRPRRV